MGWEESKFILQSPSGIVGIITFALFAVGMLILFLKSKNMAEEHKKKIKRYEDMLRINPNDSIAKKELDKINTEFALKVFKLFFFYSFILIFILIAGSLISYLLLFKLIIK